jgi:hypothetical protein
MRYAEIVPKNGSHQIVVDGKEWSRHDDVKIAEQVRSQIVADFAEELERNADRLLAAS